MGCWGPRVVGGLNQPILMPQSRLWWISAIHWKIRTFPSQSHLVGGFNPTHLKKYARQFGSFPQGSGWKQNIFETTNQECIDWFVLIFTLEKKHLYRKGAIILFSSISFPKSSICFFEKKNLPSANGLMVNWCFGARWFGFLWSP